ncbi:MAG: VOC family protein, partial [Cellulomonadaceae bacterium]
MAAVTGPGPAPTGALHHVELWVADLERARPGWHWLLGELGYEPFQDWANGTSWRLGDTYLVLERSPDLLAGRYVRTRPGLNHLAFHAGPGARVDLLAEQAPEHGWRLMFTDRHPYAGGPEHYAAYLEDADGFE